MFKLVLEEAASFSFLNELLTNNRRTKFHCRGRNGNGVFPGKVTTLPGSEEPIGFGQDGWKLLDSGKDTFEGSNRRMRSHA